LGSKEKQVWEGECFENPADKNCANYCILVEHTWTWRASSESCGEAWIFGKTQLVLAQRNALANTKTVINGSHDEFPSKITWVPVIVLR
jgi:hypothetical protein